MCVEGHAIELKQAAERLRLHGARTPGAVTSV
jgi:hypothetical protein